MSPDKYNIEKLYDDLLVAEAENLFEKKAIIDVSRPEKPLFVFVINDGVDLETEILKPFTKVQKSTCPCLFHQQHAICKHVIAGLLYLRAQKKETQKNKPETSAQNPKVLQIHTILQHVEREELIHFVRDYARRDARFALQLKIHFAKNVDLPNNREKYAQLLNAIIKPNTGKTKPNQNELKAFLKVTDDLIDQMEDSLALEQFEEAFYILQAGFYKFCYVQNYHGQESNAFLQQNTRWMRAIESFLQEKIPYSLKKQIKDFLMDLAFLSFYRYTDVESNVAMALKSHLGAGEKKHFLHKLSGHAKQLTGEERTNVLVIMAYISENLSGEVGPWLDQSGFPILSFFKQLSQLQAWDLCRAIIRKVQHTAGVPAELFLWQTENLCLIGALEEALESALHHFNRTGQMAAIQKIYDSADQVNWLETLKPEIEKTILSDHRPVSVAAYLHWSKNWDSLYHFIMTQAEIIPFLKYLTDMALHKPDETEDLITHHLTVYLETHLGEKSQQDLLHFFKLMDGVKLFSLRKKVAANLAKSYPERQALVQWLESI